MRRRESSGECLLYHYKLVFNLWEDQLTAAPPRKLSLSSTQAPLSPRDAALPSPRTRFGHTPTFDGVLNGGESWVARRRASEAKAVARDTDHHEGRGSEIREEDEDANPDSGSNAIPQEIPQATASPSHDPPASTQPKTGDGSPHVQNGSDSVGSAVPNGPPPGIRDLASVQWSYLDPQGQLQGQLDSAKLHVC
jgi:PERQ amino acid-rich with GYF domain-containing protein